LGNKKTRLQVLPASEEGMSKLKMLETVEDTVPLNEVPGALLGEEESTGMIRWGNSNCPERLVGQLALEDWVAGVED
jgi:peptide subunit release factor 1 (eRF1)